MWIVDKWMERDDKGRFLEGHKVPEICGEKLVEYNKINGSPTKGKKFGEKSLKIKEKQSESMGEKHKNPTWNEEERRKKISEKLQHHKVSKETRLKIKKKAKYSKKQGINFEYRALHFMEKQKGVIQVIRSAGSRDIDLTVIWDNGNSFLISKEEVKSSLKWFNTLSQNPLCLLDKDDREKLINAHDKGFEIFLIYREPKIKKNGELMESQNYVKRVELGIEDEKIFIKK